MNSSFQSESQPLLPRSPSFSFHEKGSILSRLRSWIESYTAVLREFLSREEAPIIICVFALQFLFSFAKHIVEVPAIRLYEIAICNKYYRTHDIDNGNGAFIIAQDIPERLCKVAPVQETLAAVVGWKFSFDALPGRYIQPK